MTIHTDFADLAVSLLDTFGAPATLQRVARVYVPATAKTTSSTTEIAVRAVLKESESTNSNGDLVISTSATLAAKTTSQAPQVDDLLVMAGKTYRVVSVHTSAPVGNAITYRLALGAL